MSKGRVLAAAALLSLFAGAGVAQAEPLTELGYKAGALGVAAIAQGDYRTAETQLDRMDGVAAGDPARLINLGQVYARTGRYKDAERAYRAAMAAPAFDVVLTNGSVVSTREAARRASRTGSLRGAPRAPSVRRGGAQ